MRDNIVESAAAHGMPGEVLDGNDAVAVYQAAREAVARARQGQGPTLLECRTYRWRGHVGPSLDVDVGVTRKDELAEWRARDPIPRLRAELLALGARAEELDSVVRDAEDEVEAAVVHAREAPYPDPAELRSHVFSEPAGEGR